MQRKAYLIARSKNVFNSVFYRSERKIRLAVNMSENNLFRAVLLEKTCKVGIGKLLRKRRIMNHYDKLIAVLPHFVYLVKAELEALRFTLVQP